MAHDRNLDVPEHITTEYLAELPEEAKDEVIKQIIARVDNTNNTMQIFRADLALLLKRGSYVADT